MSGEKISRMPLLPEESVTDVSKTDVSLTFQFVDLKKDVKILYIFFFVSLNEYNCQFQ